MKISYKKIFPKRRYKDQIIDHYYDLTAGDFLSDDECREQELIHIRHVLLRRFFYV